MPANTATLDALLKDDAAPAIESQLQDETPELDLFERDDEPWQGREKQVVVHVNRNRGSYFTAEGGTPPTAGRQQLEMLRIPMRYHHAAIQITKQLMLASRSSQGSFARAMRLEMDRMVDDLRIQRAFALWGDGRAIRALVNGTMTTTTVTVDAPGGLAGATNGSRFLNVGDWVVAIVPATGGLRQTTAYEINSVPAAGTTFTTTSAVTWTDNDYIVKSGAVSGTVTVGNVEFNHAPMGLNGIVDNGTYINTYFGLSRTTFPILNSTVITGVGALSADVLQRAFDVSMQVGNGQVEDLLMHPSVLRAYLAVTEQDRRYTGGDLMTPDAGTKAVKAKWDTGIAFGGVPLRRCIDAPYGSIFGVDRGAMVRYVMDGGSWIDDDGAVLTRNSTAIDTFDAQYRIFENYAHLKPNTCFRLDGITSNIVVVHRY